MSELQELLDDLTDRKIKGLIEELPVNEKAVWTVMNELVTKILELEDRIEKLEEA